MEKHECSKNVWHPGSFWGDLRLCEKNGTVERDGKWYCGQHDPVAIEEKRRKRQDMANWELQDRTERQFRERELSLLKDACYEACCAVNPDNPLAVAQGIPEAFCYLKELYRSFEISVGKPRGELRAPIGGIARIGELIRSMEVKK